MMVDIDLSPKEYGRVLKWYFLAFAKLDSDVIKEEDKKLKNKIEVMKEAVEQMLEEQAK